MEEHTNFNPGDRVRLFHGDSKGIVGTVEKVLSPDLVSVVLNRKRTTYCLAKDLRFVRPGNAPTFTDVWLGEEGK